MLKKVIILVVLSIILLVLALVKGHTSAPVNTTPKSNASSGYITMVYKITDIKGNQYYGKAKDGTGIHFSSKSIHSGDKIQVSDEVICYFEKNNLGKGLVKVEKKE
jgi:hypothetical protein